MMIRIVHFGDEYFLGVRKCINRFRHEILGLRFLTCQEPRRTSSWSKSLITPNVDKYGNISPSVLSISKKIEKNLKNGCCRLFDQFHGNFAPHCRL